MVLEIFCLYYTGTKSMDFLWTRISLTEQIATEICDHISLARNGEGYCERIKAYCVFPLFYLLHRHGSGRRWLTLIRHYYARHEVPKRCIAEDFFFQIRKIISRCVGRGSKENKLVQLSHTNLLFKTPFSEIGTDTCILATGFVKSIDVEFFFLDITRPSFIILGNIFLA